MTFFRRALAVAGSPAAIYLTASVFSRAGAIALIPLYTRRLSLEEYGQLLVAQSAIGILPTFLTWGMIAAVGRAFYEGSNRAESNLKVGEAARWLVIITLGTAIALQLLLLLVLPDFAGKWSLKICSILLWAGAATGIAAVPSVYFRAAQLPVRAAAFQITPLFLEIAAGAILVAALGLGFDGAVLATAGVAAVQALVSVAFITAALPARLNCGTGRHALRFSLPLIPHFLGNQLQQVSDRWIMEANQLNLQLGSYGLASQVSSPMSMVIIAWNDSKTAQLGETWRSGGLKALGMVRKSFTLSYVRIAAIAFLGVVVITPLAALCVGTAFRHGLWLVPIFCLISMVEVFYFPAANIVFMSGNTYMIPRVTVLSGGLNVALNLILIPTWGVSGAFVARFLAAFVRSGGMHIMATRSLRERSSAALRGAG